MDRVKIPPHVEFVFLSYPDSIRERLLGIRDLVYQISFEDDCIGGLEETLKWGEPSYVPKNSKMATSVRLAWSEKRKNHFSLLVNCNTSIIERFRSEFSVGFNYIGKREIRFFLEDVISETDLKRMIQLVFTYKSWCKDY